MDKKSRLFAVIVLLVIQNIAFGAFPNDASITKLLYLAIRNIAKRWTMPIHNWKAALNQFVILYSERVSA